MAQEKPKGLFDRLDSLFSSENVLRNVGGNQIKVMDVNKIQTYGNIKTNSLVDRFTKLHRYGSNMSYNPTMNYQTLRIQLYTDYEAMDTESIIASALDIVADEATLKNESGEVLQIRSSDENIQRILYNLFYDVLNVEFNLWTWIRNMCKYGDLYLHLDIAEKFGVYNVSPLSTYDMIREEGMDPSNPSKVVFKIDPTIIAMGGMIPAQPKHKDAEGKLVFENYEIAHFRLLTDANFLPYGRCSSLGTRVYTEKGIKEIQNIQEGDKIWTFNIQENKYEIANVLATCNSGIKKLYKVKTRHNEIKCTDNHPVLIWNFEQDKPDYKQVKEIQKGDYICSYKKIDMNLSNPILNKNIISKTHGLQDMASLKSFPDVVTSEFARFWGFMLGDGWVNNSQGHIVGFAQGIREDRNEYYKNLLMKFSGKDKLNKLHSKTSKVSESGVSVCSKLFHELMTINGYIGKSYSKRLPSWIYECDEETQLSLITGLMDADGFIFTDKWDCNSYNLTLNNKELLVDIKTLLDRLKIKTGTIRPRKFTGKCIINGKEYNARQAYDFTFYMDGKRKQQYEKFNQINPEYNVEIFKIESITEELPDETYDICVDRNSNFIADGIIVHNSYIEPARKVYKQYTLMKDAMLLHRIMRAPEKRVFTINVGNIPPNEVDAYMQKVMNKMKKTPYIDQNTGDYNLKFNMMNMMEDFYIPVRGNDQTTKIDTLKGLEYNGIEDVNFLRDEMLSALKVPKAFFGFEKDLQGKATLAAEDIRFAHTVERIQRIVTSELTKIALVHLYVQGYDGESLANFELSLTTPSVVYEQEKVALWKEKVDLARNVIDLNLLPSDWIYDKIFQFSEDNFDEYRDQVVEDKKRIFRLAQIENEGNDPAKTGKSYGTPHDLAALYGKGRMGNGDGELPSTDPAPLGPPIQNASNYGTQDSNMGKDPIGKIEMGTAGQRETNMTLSEVYKHKNMLKDITIPRKQLIFEGNDGDNTLLSEKNIRTEE